MNPKELYTAPSVELIVLKTKQNILLVYSETNQTEKMGRDINEVDL